MFTEYQNFLVVDTFAIHSGHFRTIYRHFAELVELTFSAEQKCTKIGHEIHFKVD